MYLYSANEAPPVTKKPEPVKKNLLFKNVLVPLTLAFLSIPVYLMLILKCIAFFQ